MEDNTDFEYDVAISFAGEQRQEARQIALILQNTEVKVFFDEFKQADLWGKDLAEYFSEIYYKKARFCVMFISRAYATKMWPTLERRHAVARAIMGKGEYILPVKFDETELPGLAPTTHHVKWSDAEELVALILSKLEIRLDSVLTESVASIADGISADAALRSVLDGVNRYASFNIMVIGKAGVGKSSLINYLFGKQVRHVGVGRTQTPMGFHKEEIILRGIPVTIYDSGGLEAANIEEWQRRLQKELGNRGERVGAEHWMHTVLYCIGAGAERIDAFETKVIRQLVADRQRVIVVFTKADQTGEEQLKILKNTLLIDVGSDLPCVNVCSQERQIPGAGITIPRFGLDELQATIVSGFWDSIRMRLPGRCVALLQEVVERWGEKQKIWINSNVGYANKNKSLVYLNGQAANFVAEFSKAIMPQAITDEVVRTLNMFGSISRMFGLTVAMTKSRVLLDDSIDLLADAQGQLTSGLTEVLMDVFLFPISVLFVVLRGSFNRSDLEGYVKHIVEELNKRLKASEPSIAELVSSLVRARG